MISLNTTSSCVQPSVPIRKTPASVATNMIQELNNKACALLTIGDFTEANQLLGLALEKHKSAVEGSRHFNESAFDEDESSSSPDMYDSEYEYGDDDMDTSSNDTFDHYFDCPRDQEQGSNTSFPSSVPEVATSKMTTCTQVCNTPCAGQQDSRSFTNHCYHKVYSMPIVVDDTEWESASSDDRSFVLVFNSALSNHLLGMQLLPAIGTKCNRGPFEIAKALYLLALETLWNTGNSSGFNGGQIRSADKLCVPAIFNNLSHVSKILDGYDSEESSVYDSVLLKSVLWWIDGNFSVYAASSSSFNSSDLRRASDGDTEVIEAFLDTVFYLVGAPESTAPAAAA